MRLATVHFFTIIGAHAAGFLGAGVLIGLAVPPLAHAFRPLLMPAMLLPLVLALVRLDWGAFGAYARRPGLIALITVWLLGFSLVLVWLALKPLGLPESLFVALVLATLSAPIVASAALSLLVGFDAALAVVAVVVTTALVPLTLPPLAASLLGVALKLDMLMFMIRLGLIVGVAFGGAAVVRHLIPGETVAGNAQVLDGIAVVSMIVFVVAIMDGVTALALEKPAYVVGATAAAFTANIALQGLATAVWLWLGVRQALAIGLMTGNRNMGLVLVALGGDAPLEVIAFFAVGQIPMYILPGLLAQLYRQLLARAQLAGR
jgi:predicted Na+-dependent transporter